MVIYSSSDEKSLVTSDAGRLEEIIEVGSRDDRDSFGRLVGLRKGH